MRRRHEHARSRFALIPIRDINPRSRLPWVNYAILALVALAFAHQLRLGREVDQAIAAGGFVPSALERALSERSPAGLWASLQTVLTAMFLHGGWFHVLGNLMYLRVFGDNVEDRLGHVGYLCFYVASGVAGALGQFLAEPLSSTPMIGASGAIAGVLGAYVALFPAAKVVTLFPVFVFLTFIEVPAFVFLGVWSLQQLLNGFLSLGSGASGGVAWFAHLGGFALGLVVGIAARIAGPRRRRRR